jgi:hypothetical protein
MQGATVPRYWILSMSEDNYLITKDRGMIGITEHARPVIYHMAIGDIITFYIPRKRVDSPRNDPRHRVRKVRGIARVTGEAFESNDVIWNIREGERFPYRRPVEFLSDARVDAQPLLKGLSYVTNMNYWALPFRKGYVAITAQDFEKIQAALGVHRISPTG